MNQDATREDLIKTIKDDVFLMSVYPFINFDKLSDIALREMVKLRVNSPLAA